jgi:glycogen synthase
MGASVAVVTFSSTQFDSRVRRIVGALSEHGHAVTLIAPEDGSDGPPDVPRLALPTGHSTRAGLISQLIRTAPATVHPSFALPLHQTFNSHRTAVRHLITTRAALIHANDWISLPAALEAAASTGAKVVYDTHEFATEEHVGRAWWRLFAQPHIRAIEGQLIGKADHVITVSKGLADALRDLYGKRIKALSVVRNLPTAPVEIQSRKSASASSAIRLAYVGLIRPERRIDVMIEALALTGRNVSLDVTGFGAPAYVSTLQALAVSKGVSDRVRWHPPVAPEALVSSLDKQDIGLFLSDGSSAQQRFALPNKLFEYMAAGLAVISAGSQDVEAIITQHCNGAFLQVATPQSLAEALEGLTSSILDTWKANSAAASRELNWDAEKRILLEIYGKLAG